LAAAIGTDGSTLLRAIDQATNQPWLAQIPAVQVLRQVWAEQYVERDGQVRWREVKEMTAPATLISSPYDTEARYSTKRDSSWVGYKVHFTETCDAGAPHLIVNVETTPATTPDGNMVAIIHKSLESRDLLPAEHLVDKGYTDSRVLVDSRNDYDVTITGPVADDPSWQARSGDGFDKSQFAVDWDRHVVTCPAGKRSISWLPSTYPQNGMVFEARFARRDCTPCLLRSRCTRSKREPRILGLQAREQYEALQAARKQQGTADFQRDYAARVGIEATHGQAVRRCGLRRCRYIGLAKTHLQHIISAAAINLVRIGNWVNGTPTAQTRCSWFAALQKAA
jgi:transposase